MKRADFSCALFNFAAEKQTKSIIQINTHEEVFTFFYPVARGSICTCASNDK